MPRSTSDNVSSAVITCRFSRPRWRQCYPSLGDWIRRGSPAAFHAKRRSSPAAHVECQALTRRVVDDHRFFPWLAAEFSRPSDAALADSPAA